MRTIYYPIRDTAIYSEFPTRNTGLDEQLEIGKTNDGIDVVRTLIQFDIPTISASLSAGLLDPSSSFDLTLYTSVASNLQYAQPIHLATVILANTSSVQWQEGTGYFYQQTIQTVDGATWLIPTSGSVWATSGSDYVESINFSPFYATYLISASSQPMGDIKLDVTNLVRYAVSGSASGYFDDYGWVIKFDDTSEQNPINQGNIKFFSKDTHTIYKPVLTAKWNDQTYSTGSLRPSPTSSLLVVPGNLKAVYSTDETVRVDLYVRERYPLKTFTDTFSTYDGQRYLPTTSYFSIVDVQSGTVIIPFDDNSRVSVDPNNSYITFNIQNMYPRRYYRVSIKVVHDGLTEIFDDGSIFSVR